MEEIYLIITSKKKAPCI